MDPRHLTTCDVHPAAAEVIGGYLIALESSLPAGRRYRARILAEIADGLACVVREQTDLGAAPAAAARSAVTEFGDPRVLAAAFAREYGPVAAHRLGVRLVATGPLVGLTWVAAYPTGGAGMRTQVADLLSTLPQLPLILAVTVPAAIIAATGAGWAARWLRLPTRVVTGAALVAATGCAAGDVSLLLTALLGHRPAAAGPVSLTMVAMAVSVLRLSAAGWAGRRVARLRTVGY
jgi:hypothetical protein